MSSHHVKVAAGLEPVTAAKPVAPYQGGKKNLATRICQLIASIDHSSYAEPFVGMGGIFFRRKVRPKAEFINDWSADVHNLFRILQVHYLPFVQMMEWQIGSRLEFERLSAEDPSTLTDMQRAARFLYLQRTAFGGKISGRHFGVASERPSRFDITKLRPMLEEVHARLSAVTIERLPWSQFIERYDRAGMLYYLDPPYFGCENDYGAGMFDRGEFETMAGQLAKLKGKFILSINDCPEIRELFAAFPMQGVEVTYTVGSSTNRGKFGELIISNAFPA